MVEARSKGDWRWRVASQRDNGQRRVIATGGGRSRLEAIRAVALALHQSGYFADQQPSELVAAMIVASNRTEDGQSSHG
ncbi:MAG: hypothetical protein EA356_12180 [Geminicoccaceae bacterium]|nr:MAG: hypothetical protein EA356_12180 [Geminicoccaceae bacterium]